MEGKKVVVQLMNDQERAQPEQPRDSGRQEREAGRYCRYVHAYLGGVISLQMIGTR